MLTKPLNYKGLTWTGFFKIMGSADWETWKDEVWKLYSATANVLTFTKEDKSEFIREIESYTFENLREEEKNLTEYYNRLKLLPEFIYTTKC